MSGVEKVPVTPATAAFLRARERHQRKTAEAEHAARVAAMRRHGFNLDGTRVAVMRRNGFAFDGAPDERVASKWRAVRQLAEREALAARGAFLQANPAPRLFGVQVPA